MTGMFSLTRYFSVIQTGLSFSTLISSKINYNVEETHEDYHYKR